VDTVVHHNMLTRHDQPRDDPPRAVGSAQLQAPSPFTNPVLTSRLCSRESARRSIRIPGRKNDYRGSDDVRVRAALGPIRDSSGCPLRLLEVQRVWKDEDLGEDRPLEESSTFYEDESPSAHRLLLRTSLQVFK
jgi:hypothetical protein